MLWHRLWVQLWQHFWNWWKSRGIQAGELRCGVFTIAVQTGIWSKSSSDLSYLERMRDGMTVWLSNCLFGRLHKYVLYILCVCAFHCSYIVSSFSLLFFYFFFFGYSVLLLLLIAIDTHTNMYIRTFIRTLTDWAMHCQKPLQILFNTALFLSLITLADNNLTAHVAN